MKIQINNLTKSYVGDIILNDLSLEIVKGSKMAIVGENGSGKTTLLKVLAQIEDYQEGTIIIPKDMKIGYMKQLYEEYEMSGREFILSSFEAYKSCVVKLNELEKAMSDEYSEKVLKLYTTTLDRFEELGGYELENLLDKYAKGLGVTECLKKDFDKLSGGEKTRLALVQLLLLDYEVLCLDEPTNHLDKEGIEWLESYLSNCEKTLVIVSHDRQFLKNTVSIFCELEDGDITIYHGDYDSYRKERHERFLRLVNDYEVQQAEIQRINLAIKRFQKWGAQGNNEDMFKKAKSLEKRLARIKRLPKPIELHNKLPFKLKSSQRGSENVVIAKELVIGYDKALTEPLDFVVYRKQRFAIEASNGKGKTTLIKTLLGDVMPISGSIQFGATVDVGYLPQVFTIEDKKERILAYLRRVSRLDEETARRYLANFGFYQGDMYKYVSSLSGGEQVRLKLLEIMIAECNCLILDEPTNHLDIASCEKIEEVLTNFDGTIIVISHDRMFLESLNVISYKI